jgi:hypothetical protein
VVNPTGRRPRVPRAGGTRSRARLHQRLGRSWRLLADRRESRIFAARGIIRAYFRALTLRVTGACAGEREESAYARRTPGRGPVGVPHRSGGGGRSLSLWRAGGLAVRVCTRELCPWVRSSSDVQTPATLDSHWSRVTPRPARGGPSARRFLLAFLSVGPRHRGVPAEDEVICLVARPHADLVAVRIDRDSRYP